MPYDLSTLLLDRKAPPLELMRALLQHFGVDWLTWSYDALRLTLEKELQIQVPDWAMSETMALSAVAQQDAFWLDWHHFHFLVQALNGNVPSAHLQQELSLGEMMRAVNIANQIRTELGRLSYTVPFSAEVARYVAAQALDFGVWYLPPPLEFAARHASGLHYKCRDCGADSEVIFDDGLCDTCVGRFDLTQMRDWRPDPEKVAKGRGVNIEFYEKNPVGAIVKRLQEVRDHPDTPLKANKVDICVARLLAAMAYAELGPQDTPVTT